MVLGMSIASSRSLRRAVAVLATAGTLTLSGTATAHAERWSHTDPAGDVVHFYFESEEGVPAPAHERGDVRRVRLAHKDSRLVARFSMRKAMAGDHYFAYAIRTPKGEFELSRFRQAGAKSVVVLTEEGRETPIRCSGMEWAIDRERATVAVSIPRSCIGRPRWVRVGIGVVSTVEPGAGYADDALRSGIGPGLRRSPRLYRG